MHTDDTNTSYEMITHHQPNLTRLHVFGCQIFSHLRFDELNVSFSVKSPNATVHYNVIHHLPFDDNQISVPDLVIMKTPFRHYTFGMIIRLCEIHNRPFISDIVKPSLLNLIQ